MNQYTKKQSRTPLTGHIEDLGHINKITTAYQKKKIEQEINQQKQDMQARKIPSITVDSGDTLHCGTATDPFIHTGQVSQKYFIHHFNTYSKTHA